LFSKEKKGKCMTGKISTATLLSVLFVATTAANAQTPNAKNTSAVVTDQDQTNGDVDKPFILGRLYDGQSKYLPPVTLAREQTLKVELTNRLGSNRQKDLPKMYAVVQLYDEKSRVIARSEKVNLPLNQPRSVNFDRGLFRLYGDYSGPDQVKTRVGVEVYAQDPNVVYISSGGGVWASSKVIDNKTGETTNHTPPRAMFFLKNTNAASKPGSGNDVISNSTRGNTNSRPDSVSDRTTSVSAPELQFVGKEAYEEADGNTGTRYKLAVTNRASYPQALWRPSANLPPCGKNENASRTWVEIFGSPGDKRLGGFCTLGSSEDLGQLWFAVPAGVKGPPCVYMVMTDRQTAQKYESERICSRSFTVVTGRLKGDSPENQSVGRDKYLDLNSWGVIQPGPDKNKRRP
jgi:hypothetical protein